MIEAGKCKAIYLLHEEGMSIREISLRLGVSRKTVRRVIARKGEKPDRIRDDTITIDPELLIRLYTDCDGWIQRVHEKLVEEEGINIGYSTLTRILRKLEISKRAKSRCDRVPDKLGDEMQHDTSEYKVKLGERNLTVIGSHIYFRYSKVRYLKFYRGFNRFKMKCFLHEALTCFGYAAAKCIIDNTNLARLHGTGKNAVMVPEMDLFAKQYQFKFLCHEIRHSNRKAGVECGFRTVKSNFFPGRKFDSMEDLNVQAYKWATDTMVNRPLTKARLIPGRVFEYEKLFLKRLAPYIPAPYLIHERCTDQYGYAAFNGNFYWIPGTKRENVLVLEYSDHLQIFQNKKLVAKYLLPTYGVKNKSFSPEGKPESVYMPRSRKKPTQDEEKKLRALSEEIDVYLTFALSGKRGKGKHKFIRQLYALSRKLALSVFVATIKRALKYQVIDMNTIESIAVLKINDVMFEMPQVELDEEFKDRPSYLDGRFSDEPDLSKYEELMEEKNDG